MFEIYDEEQVDEEDEDEGAFPGRVPRALSCSSSLPGSEEDEEEVDEEDEEDERSRGSSSRFFFIAENEEDAPGCFTMAISSSDEPAELISER